MPRPAWLAQTEFPFTSRTLQGDGARMHYVDEGRGRPVLFIHGSPMWSFMYRRAIARLSGRFRCVAVDLPGLGLSTARLRWGHAHQDAATHLRRFVAQLDLQDAVLVVHATAGPAALEMAVAERERLSGLVISNTFAWPLDGDPTLAFFVRVVSSRIFGWANVGLNILARVAAWAGRRGGRFTHAERRAILGPFRDRQARRHLQNLLYGVRVERPRFARLHERLPELAGLPTLLLYGAHDNGYRAGFVERWQSILPNHALAVLPSAGHFPFEDDPEGAVDALEGWLDGESARTSGTLSR